MLLLSFIGKIHNRQMACSLMNLQRLGYCSSTCAFVIRKYLYAKFSQHYSSVSSKIKHRTIEQLHISYAIFSQGYSLYFFFCCFCSFTVVWGLRFWGWLLRLGFWGWAFQLMGFFGVGALCINIEE